MARQRELPRRQGQGGGERRGTASRDEGGETRVENGGCSHERSRTHHAPPCSVPHTESGVSEPAARAKQSSPRTRRARPTCGLILGRAWDALVATAWPDPSLAPGFRPFRADALRAPRTNAAPPRSTLDSSWRHAPRVQNKTPRDLSAPRGNIGSGSSPRSLSLAPTLGAPPCGGLPAPRRHSLRQAELSVS